MKVIKVICKFIDNTTETIVCIVCTIHVEHENKQFSETNEETEHVARHAANKAVWYKNMLHKVKEEIFQKSGLSHNNFKLVKKHIKENAKFVNMNSEVETNKVAANNEPFSPTSEFNPVMEQNQVGGFYGFKSHKLKEVECDKKICLYFCHHTFSGDDWKKIFDYKRKDDHYVYKLISRGNDDFELRPVVTYSFMKGKEEYVVSNVNNMNQPSRENSGGYSYPYTNLHQYGGHSCLCSYNKQDGGAGCPCYERGRKMFGGNETGRLSSISKFEDLESLIKKNQDGGYPRGPLSRQWRKNISKGRLASEKVHGMKHKRKRRKSVSKNSSKHYRRSRSRQHGGNNDDQWDELQNGGNNNDKWDELQNGGNNNDKWDELQNNLNNYD